MPKLGQQPLVQSFTIHEAAQILGVSTKTLRRWEKQKLIAPERTLGNQRRYRQNQLDVILRQRSISKLLIPASVRKLFKLSSTQKFTLAAIVTLAIISASLLVLNQIGIQYSFSLKLPQLKSDVHSQTFPNVPFPTGAVLAAQTSSGSLILKANVPTFIDSTATVSGNLTAPNIVYNLLEGTGINITGDPQTPTIATTDQTADLKIFSTFKVGSTEITAGSKTDTFTFVAGSNVSLSANTTDKKLTIAASLTDPGWTDDGSIVRLSSASDSVSIGIATAEAKLNVFGQATGKALALFNETGDQAIFTASAGGISKFTIANSGQITSGSSNVTMTLATGFIDADALTLAISTDGAGPTSSFSGLEVYSDGLTLIQGCADGQLLEWTDAAGWACADDNDSGAVSSFNFWQYSSADGTLAPGNLTVDTLFGSTATSSARVRISGSATGGLSALIVNQPEDTDIFTASAGGTPRFTIQQNGDLATIATLGISATALNLGNGAAAAISTLSDDNLTLLAQGTGQVILNDTVQINSGTPAINSIAYSTDALGTIAFTAQGGAGLLCLTSTGGAAPTWDSCDSAAATANFWQYSSADGTLAPGNLTVDTLFGSTATSSAKLVLAGSATGGKSALIINQTENTDIFSASSSGVAVFTITQDLAAIEVNGITLTGAATAAAPTFAATGADTNIGLTFNPKGTGTYTINSGATTGTGFSLLANSLSTGTGFYPYSTSTSLSSGKLGYFNWEPSAVATASGDLVGINIGNAGDTTGNLFNITSSGSSLFSVSETGITSALPHSFTAAGDVSLAYDLLFTNQTASYLKSNASLYIQAGEIFESNNLTLKSYNSGTIIFDTDTAGKVLIGTGSASLKFTVSDSFAATAAAMIENQFNGSDADGLAIKLGYTGNGATTNRFISFLNGSGVTVGRVEATTGLGVAYQTSGIDFAEYFVKDSTQFEEGDIVTLKSGGAAKSDISSDPNMIGIVSTSPGFKGGEEGPNKVLVGLVGQVPLKISPASGPIQPGDLLTSSSDPGRAIKAARPGFTIAKALESWSPGSGQDKILAFINPVWADPTNSLASLLAAPVSATPAPPEPTPVDEARTAEGVDLRVLARLQVEGALTVTGETNFLGTVFFNTDTAGFAAIPAGARYVTVNYDKEYLQPPIVTASPVWDTDPNILGAAIDQPVSLLPKQDYIIAASTATGFTILLEQPAVIDLKFTWTAISVKDPRTVSAPTPTPSPTITPTPEPTAIPTPTPTPND